MYSGWCERLSAQTDRYREAAHADEGLVREMMEVTDGEIEVFFSAVFHRYGYDFRSYSQNFYETLNRLTITVTNLFRDPAFYRSLKDHVLPALAERKGFKVWHAGCSSGEELFSLMMLLAEADLLDEAILYGTDINPEALRRAKAGILGSDVIRKGARAYHDAGGQQTIMDYFRVNHGYGLFQKSKKANLVFSVHNLATDSAFGEMQLIFCRNVLIYFNEALRDRALELITESLSQGAFLCLGLQETLMFSSVDRFYDTIDSKHKIYRKK
ncbi:MAG: protein-glutamate O-methyltransferase CheR [Proteobacteria bacterium]|nr:MAG: protein-glutamate O-methyltransferase CheR [Pseudomonadota bacterium]